MQFLSLCQSFFSQVYLAIFAALYEVQKRKGKNKQLGALALWTSVPQYYSCVAMVLYSVWLAMVFYRI